MQDPHLSPQTFSQARHPTKTREINGTETPHTTQTTAAGNQIIAQSRSAAGHGDLGIALIIGAFASQHLQPQVVGQYSLRGWF